jgi:hypothetical protein
MSLSPTLFSGSGPVGLPTVPWTEKTTEREVGPAKDLSVPLQNIKVQGIIIKVEILNHDPE